MRFDDPDSLLRGTPLDHPNIVSSICEISFTARKFNVACIVKGEPQIRRHMPFNRPDADLLNLIRPKRASSSGSLHSALLLSHERRSSVFGYSSPPSGAEYPIAAFPRPWGYSFRAPSARRLGEH